MTPVPHPSTDSARPGRYVSELLENRSLSRRYYLLVLRRPAAMAAPLPGSFIHVSVEHGGRFFLRRPFSVLDCDANTLSLIVVEKGEGTQLMRTLSPGARMDFIGPLGCRFPRAPGKRVLALGGGVGLAPLYFYARRRDTGDCAAMRLLYGARNREDLFLERFEWDKAKAAFATDDGSYGFGGNVVQFAETEIDRFGADVVFSCGPNVMLKAAARLAAERGLPHFVSLENRMACALGACRSCVVLARDGDELRYRTVCKEGPVFDAATLVWEELPEASA